MRQKAEPFQRTAARAGYYLPNRDETSVSPGCSWKKEWEIIPISSRSNLGTISPRPNRNFMLAYWENIPNIYFGEPENTVATRESGNPLNQVLAFSIRKLLTPLVRILLRHGVPFRTLADLAKRVYVDVASAEFGIPGRKKSDSRVSVITGLSRKEVRRVRELVEPDDMGTVARFNRAARVIGGWVRDASYHDASGEPAPLSLEGDGPTFSRLVERYSGDVPVRAILDELVRVGAVEQAEDSTVRLLTRAYVPKAGEEEKLGILGTDVGYLMGTIDHNLECGPGDAYFQRKVFYNNLPSEAVPEFKELAARHSQELLELLDGWLAERDRDANPDVEGTGRRAAGVGIYFFEEDLDGKSEKH